MTKYEQNYEDFWKALVEKDGELDVDAVKRELSDFYTIIQNVPIVYCEITGYRMSKPNYAAADVLREHNEHCPLVPRTLDEFIELGESEGWI